MLSANAIVVVAGVVMFVIIVMGRARELPWLAVALRCALICAVAVIVSVTLFPVPVDARLWKFHHLFSNMHFVPFGTIRTQLAFGLEHSEARQLIGNVALFVPFGFLLPAAVRTCRRLWVTLVVAAGLSVLIEILQALLPSHATDVDDMILNTAGAALGFLAFSVVARMVKRRIVPEERTLGEPAASSAGWRAGIIGA
jgi:glycopeptide antibiotics resistance protein